MLVDLRVVFGCWHVLVDGHGWADEWAGARTESIIWRLRICIVLSRNLLMVLVCLFYVESDSLIWSSWEEKAYV